MLHESFATLAMDKGWNHNEQVSLLLDFIHEQDLQVSLEQYLNAKAQEQRFASINCEGKPLLAESLSKIAKNPELKLFKVVLGHYVNPKEDEFPSDTCTIYIAADCMFEAFMPAFRYKVKEQLNFPEEDRKNYTIEGDPEEVNIDDLITIPTAA
ncbi:hypothetical protein [Vibrio owensii]|uniref:hypothetical protein n=1 Tax=Vibrio harveyi group TaxID=717610 RepID=UPI003CC58A26